MTTTINSNATATKSTTTITSSSSSSSKKTSETALPSCFNEETLNTLLQNHPAPHILVPSNYFTIKNSQIPHSGHGLYANVNIPANCTLGYYTGTFMTTSEMKRCKYTCNEERGYLLRVGYCSALKRIVWIDGCPTPVSSSPSSSDEEENDLEEETNQTKEISTP
eukprot:15355242-Ditylum_brightwellii.AAC.1